MVMIPGYEDLAISAFLGLSTKEKPSCLVLMLYGAGNAPSRKASFLAAIREGVAERGAIVVVTSQCLHGRVDMTQYATGSALASVGVIDGQDMTTEATVTKLAYLVGKGLRGIQLKREMERSLRGELTLNDSQEYTRNANELYPTLGQQNRLAPLSKL
jgi:L-asparaginase/Glu-tRNA(Gln) amidotransferase subunit D